MPKTRPAYPEEFRREAVAMVRGGRSVRDIAESLGVSQQSLRKWVKQAELDGRERDDGLRSSERDTATCAVSNRPAQISGTSRQECPTPCISPHIPAYPQQCACTLSSC